MITYEQAYKIAKSVKPLIQECTEYEGGFWFDPYNNLKEGETMDGGTDAPFAIPKSGKYEGKAIGIPTFIIECNVGNAVWGCKYNAQTGEILRELTEEEIESFNDNADDEELDDAGEEW